MVVGELFQAAPDLLQRGLGAETLSVTCHSRGQVLARSVGPALGPSGPRRWSGPAPRRPPDAGQGPLRPTLRDAVAPGRARLTTASFAQCVVLLTARLSLQQS